MNKLLEGEYWQAAANQANEIIGKSEWNKFALPFRSRNAPTTNNENFPFGSTGID
jgi:hypothetical protein